MFWRLNANNLLNISVLVLDESSAQCKTPRVRLEVYFTNTFADSGYIFTPIPDIVSWKKSVAILIHKKNDSDDPANWILIALSNNI